MTTAPATTIDLIASTRVRVPARFNASGYDATVQSVEPWILSAGPHAGQQARNGRGNLRGELLYTVVLIDVVRTTPPLGPMSAVDLDADQASVRHLAVPAQHLFDRIA